MNCISCFKEMLPPVKHRLLLHRDDKWRISQSALCDNACNWCYWYAWDNAVRVGINIQE
jgi:hypothetical protein